MAQRALVVPWVADDSGMTASSRAPRLRRLAAVVLLACASTLTLSSCMSSYGDASYQPSAQQDTSVAGSSSSNSGSASSGSGSSSSGSNATVLDRQMVTTGSVSITVEHIDEARAQVESAATSAGGYVQARDESAGEDGGSSSYSSITIRIPADKYDATLESIRGIGQVTSVETQAEDVTLEVADTEARVKTLESSIASLRTMMEQAKTVDEMLAVEKEISTRQEELDGLKAQLQTLKDDIAMSTLTVRLYGPDAEVEEPGPPSFFDGVAEGWNDFVRNIGYFLAALGYMLPLLVVLAVLGLALWFIIRRAVRNSKARAAANPVQAARQPMPGQMPQQAVRPNGIVIPAAQQPRGPQSASQRPGLQPAARAKPQSDEKPSTGDAPTQ